MSADRKSCSCPCSCQLQAHRDPAMYNALTTYLNGLVTSGVKLINHFQHMGQYSSRGSWGLLEWNDQDTKTSPKWQVCMCV
jgi:hypothetical protein